jgi:hypothetical protein
MARIRTVKPELWNDEKLGQESEQVMLTYIGTWSFSDDYGVVKANPLWLKNQIFPYKEKLRIDTFSAWLKALEKLDALILLVHRNESFYYIRTFRKHQRVDKPSKARNLKEEDLIFYLTELGYYMQPDGDCVKKHSANTTRILPEYSTPEIVSSNSKGNSSSKGGEETTLEEKVFKSLPEKIFYSAEKKFSADFFQTWVKLCETSKWRKKEASALELAIKKLSTYDELFSIQLMERAITGGYQGVVFSNTDDDYKKWLNSKNNNNGTKSQTPSGLIIPNGDKTYGTF